MQFSLRKAWAADVKDIHSSLLEAASGGVLLPRSLSELYNHIRDFYVAVDPDGRFAGCCALSIVWDDIAEVRSLFVSGAHRGNGLGRKLVEACMDEGRALGIQRVFTLTYQTEFFSRLAFAEVNKDVLPHKIWADCIHCPKFPDCDEIAMLRGI